MSEAKLSPRGPTGRIRMPPSAKDPANRLKVGSGGRAGSRSRSRSRNADGVAPPHATSRLGPHLQDTQSHIRLPIANSGDTGYDVYMAESKVDTTIVTLTIPKPRWLHPAVTLPIWLILLLAPAPFVDGAPEARKPLVILAYLVAVTTGVVIVLRCARAHWRRHARAWIDHVCQRLHGNPSLTVQQACEAAPTLPSSVWCQPGACIRSIADAVRTTGRVGTVYRLTTPKNQGDPDLRPIPIPFEPGDSRPGLDLRPQRTSQDGPSLRVHRRTRPPQETPSRISCRPQQQRQHHLDRRRQ